MACASEGHVFCRECAISNLLTQRKEIKRLETEYEKKRQEEADQELFEDEEARQRAVEEFERVQTGLNAKLGEGRSIVGRANGRITVEEEVRGGPKGTKRKFELDEEELLNVAKEDRERVKRAMLNDKVRL